MNVVVNGLMANYQKAGTGEKTLVFLHGWGDTSATFAGLMEKLQNRYKVLSLDLPGFGGSQMPERAWGVQDYANFVKDWLKKIDVSEVHAIIGHSYGGSIAIAGTGNHTLRPKRLVLVAASGIRGVHRVRRAVLRGSAKVVKVPLKLLPGHLQRRLKRKVYQTIGSDAMLLPHMELTYKRLMSEDLRTVAKGINVPTLLVYGSKDKDTPVKYGRLFHSAIPKSRLEVVNAGHFVHQEIPDELAGMVDDFLKEGK